MKRAYVKPAFIAEAFEMTEYVANACTKGTNESIALEKGSFLCYNYDADGNIVSGDEGHKIGGKQGNTGDALQYWDVAGEGKGVCLFTNASVECDFLWSGVGSNVFGWADANDNLVWKEADRNALGTNATFHDFGQKLMKFFCGNGADNGQHNPGYDGGIFFS